MALGITDAVTRILSQPSPVILIDTCSFVDLFRRDDRLYQPRVPAQEISAAVGLLNLLNTDPEAVHLIVPELIPREYADNADREEAKLHGWTEFHDQNQEWLVEASLCIALALPAPTLVHPLGLAARLRLLADTLLRKATILNRDQGCLDRAVERLINKTRPSHRNEIKDSMNLEQCLELSRQLEGVGFPKSRVWVSSNTNDFAQTATSSQLHVDLRTDFTAVGLKYFTSLNAAMQHLKASGEIP